MPAEPPVGSARRWRIGRGLGAAVTSLVLPGLGQLYLRRRRGFALVGLTVGVLAVGVWAASSDPMTLFRFVVRPGVLVWLMVANGALLAARLYALLDAYVTGARPFERPALPLRRTSLAGTATVLVVLAALVAAPHAVAGVYVASAQGALRAAFVDDSPSTEPAMVGNHVPKPTPEEPPEPVVEEPPEPPNPWLDQERITIALLGSDGGPGRRGERVDSLMVATVDPHTGDAAIFSVDRSFEDFPLPDGLRGVHASRCLEGEGGGWQYLNALYRCGRDLAPEQFAALYPDAEDPAAAAMAETLGLLLGIPVPYYAKVDMAGFVGIVDALGGVEVNLAEPLHVRVSPARTGDEPYVVDLGQGPQHLGGREALAFVRIRADNGGDPNRSRRQRCLINSIVDTADVAGIIRGFPTIAAAIEENVTTSIPISLLPDLIELLPRVDAERVVSIGYGPPEYRPWGAVAPDVDLIRERTQETLTDPDAVLARGGTVETGRQACT